MPRYMLLQHYSGPADCAPMPEWAEADVRAHIDFQLALNAALVAAGELIDAQGLAGPDQAIQVTSRGQGAPTVTDGPFPEAKELLAGYRIVDVDSRERAVEIAAQISAAPGPNGDPIGTPVEVREVMSAHPLDQ